MWTAETWKVVALAEFGVIALLVLVVILASRRRGR